MKTRLFSLIYINKNKGKTWTLLAGGILGIYFMVVAIFYSIGLVKPYVWEILKQITLQFFNSNYSFIRLWPVIFFICIWVILDGFIDGIIMKGLNLFGTWLLRYWLLENGYLFVYLNIKSYNLTIAIDLQILLFWMIVGFFWMFLWEWAIFTVKLIKSNEANKENKKLKKEQVKKEVVENDAFENEVVENETSENEVVENKELELNKDTGDKIIENKLSENTHYINKIRANESRWIDRATDTIILEDDERIISNQINNISNNHINKKDGWLKLKGEFKKTFVQFYLLDSLSILAFSFAYAFITYYSIEKESILLNNTVEAFFFSLWFILFGAVQSPRHYIRAYFFLVISLSIQFTLLKTGIITFEALFLINYLVYYSKFFFFDLTPYFTAMSIGDLILFLSKIVSILLLILFILMIINQIFIYFRGKQEIEIFITTKYLYFRRKREFNDFDIFLNLIYAWLWPYNVRTYFMIYRELKYERVSLNESYLWEYGRLSYDKAIRKIVKRKINKIWRLLFIVVLITIGQFLLMVDNIFGVLLYLWSFQQMWLIIRKKTLYNISISFYRRHSQGAAFLLNTENFLKLYDIPKEILDLIPSIKEINK